MGPKCDCMPRVQIRKCNICIQKVGICIRTWFEGFLIPFLMACRFIYYQTKEHIYINSAKNSQKWQAKLQLIGTITYIKHVLGKKNGSPKQRVKINARFCSKSKMLDRLFHSSNFWQHLQSVSSCSKVETLMEALKHLINMGA